MDTRTFYGGQAVIEGVMMRGPRFFAIACRRLNKEIVVELETVESILKFSWMKLPFLRGILSLLDTLMLGMKSLSYSANVAMQDIEDKPGQQGKSTTNTQKVNDITVGVTMVTSLTVGVGIFIIGPHLMAQIARNWTTNPMWFNVTEGAIRLLLFTAYICVISFMKDIRRVWQYHGAEHKVINTYEAGKELTPENIAMYKTIHPRCGTSFMMFVLIMTVIVYSFLGWSEMWYMRILYRLLLLPVIAGVGYEVIKIAGRFRDSRLLSVVLAPGLWLQWLTTSEPTDDQVEVALSAFKAVREKEEMA